MDVDKELSSIQVRELVLPSGETNAKPEDVLSADVARAIDKDELRALGYRRNADESDRPNPATGDRLGFI